MYQQYLVFIADEKNQKAAREQFDSQYGQYLGKPTQDQLDDILLKSFIDEERDKAYKKEKEDGQSYRYDIDHCILLDFPKSVIAPILEKFVASPYNYAFSGDEEIVKLIYNLWPDYMDQSWQSYDQTFPHNKIFNALLDIKEALYEFQTLDTKEKLYEKCKEKHQAFYNWHLLAFFPLLGEEGLPILMHMTKQRYNNAQDLLMFGLAQYEPKTFLPYLTEIFSFWHTNDNICFETSTGMIGQLEDLIKKYNKQGVNVYETDKIREILESNDVYEKL